MRILIADGLAGSAVDRLQELGHDCDVRTDVTGDRLPSEITGFDILIVRSTPVSAETIEASDRLIVIIRAGAGTNTIDTDAAASRGIYVCNVPGRNAAAVAELTMGLLLAVDRRIPDNVTELRAGRWNKRRFSQARGLLGRAIGIVGLGRVGLAVAERATAFGLRVFAIEKVGRNPETVRRSKELGVRFVPDLTTLAETCDILTFHVPATDETRGIIDADLLAHMREGTVLINTSRGELVDEDALIEAMQAKGIRCGMDTYPNEPADAEGPFDSPLVHHPNVYGTHHIGASTEQAQEAIASEVVRIVELLEQGTVLHCVNLEDRVLGTSTISVRHYDEVGVLSEVLTTLKNANINVEQMENRIFEGARSAVATMHVSGQVTSDLRQELEAIGRVLGVTVTHRGEPSS
jgi:D-3-phosphoglycerate dehydrogenase